MSMSFARTGGPRSTTSGRPQAEKSRQVLAAPAGRRGFSLVELLVSITIVSLLASVVLFGMSGVTQSAREQRTRAQIAKLHEILVEAWESIEEFQTSPPQAPPAWWMSLGAAEIQTRNWPMMDRLRKLRTIARMELPDRFTDVISPNWISNNTSSPWSWYFDPNPLTAPSSATPGARYYVNFIASHQLPGKNWGDQHASAECLYMIVSRLEAGGASALESISPRDIGDTDRDGLPEILDGWRRPIRFIRWPAGFLSPSPLNAATIYKNASPMQGGGYDSFDHFGVDASANGARGFFIFPLIFSAGPDGEYDLSVDTQGNPLTYSAPANGNNNDPYVQMSSGASDPAWLIGRPDGNGDGKDNWSDNIHNHALAVGDR